MLTIYVIWCKKNSAYKSIGEVAKILNLINKKNGNLNTHTIRFWEKEFKQIKPKKINNKRRYYDKKNIDLLIMIKFLLKDKGMTIKGVKKVLNDKRFNLDGEENLPISMFENNLKIKLIKISNILKELKNIK